MQQSDKAAKRRKRVQISRFLTRSCTKYCERSKTTKAKIIRYKKDKWSEKLHLSTIIKRKNIFAFCAFFCALP